MDKPVSVSTSVVPKSQCRSALGIVFLPALVWTVGGLIALMRTSDPTLVRQVLYPLVGTELVVAGTLLLVVHAWVFGTQPNPGPAAGLVVVAVVCAGLAVEHLTAAADLFAVSLAALTVGLLIRRPRAFASAGMILGAATALSPLLFGAVVGVLSAARRMDAHSRARRLTVRFGTGATLGLVLVGLAGWLDGWPLWIAVRVPEPLSRLGPAAVWRFGADVADLAAPLLGLGLLGLWIGGWVKAPGESPVGPASLDHAMRLWMLVNALALLLFPRVCAAHAIVWLAPPALLVPAGWRAVRTAMAAAPAFSARLALGAFASLLMLLAWPAIRATGERIIIAVAAL